MRSGEAGSLPRTAIQTSRCRNLPFGVFAPDGGAPRGGVAIGDAILDLPAALNAGLFDGAVQEAAELAARPSLNSFLNLEAGARAALRGRLFENSLR